VLSLLPLFIAGAYVGWNIGANDAGNCVGTTVGSGLLSYRRAILLVAVFAILGALLQGGNVMKTIGKGIVTSELPSLGIIAALLSSGLFVTLATFLRIPVSTSQAIVGGVAGVGWATGAEMNLAKLGTIAQVWVVCPFLTGLLAFGIYWLTRTMLRRLGRESFWQRAPNLLLILSACYVSFALGANNVGNAMGPIANLGVRPTWLGLLGGVALATGTLTFGRRVTETVGSGITPLDPVSAFSAQMAAAFAVHFFSIVGIPVSTSQAIVGAVIGVGILHGIHTVRKRKIAGIVVGWIATPTAAGLFSFGLYQLLQLVLG
jgi:PiT family inorganic phosphate transporter